MPLPRSREQDFSNSEVLVQEVTFKPGRGDITTVTQATNRTTADTGAGVINFVVIGGL